MKLWLRVKTAGEAIFGIGMVLAILYFAWRFIDDIVAILSALF